MWKDALEYLLNTAADHGILKIVLIVVLIVLVIFILMGITLAKFINFFKSELVKYSSENTEEEKKEELLLQNQKEIAELRSDMNDSLMRIESYVEKIASNDEKQNKIIQDQLAHTISDACNKILDRDVPMIKASELQTILRLYKSYSEPPINGNSFIHILVLRCTKLPISNDGTEGYISNYIEIKEELENMEDEENAI